MGAGEEEPKLRLVRLPFDQVVHQRDGLGKLVLPEDATGEAQLPFRGIGLEQERVAEGRLGGDEVFLRDVSGTEQAEGVAVPPTQLDRAGQRLDSRVRAALLELDEAEVFVGAQVGGKLAGGALQIFGRLVRAVELVRDRAKREIKDRAGFRRGLGPQFEVSLDHVGGGEVGNFGEGFLFRGR